MLSAKLPESFDPTILARENFACSEDVPVSAFPRLVEALVSSVGVVRVTLQGAMSADQRPTTSIGLLTSLEQSCQRCLQPVTVVIDHARVIEWVADAQELARLDALEEDSMPSDREFLPMPVPSQVQTLVLIEDELILSLPIVALHEVCGLPVEVNDVADEHPFAALAQLKSTNRLN